MDQAMTISERALGQARTRAERVRARKARIDEPVEPISRGELRPARRKRPPAKERRRYNLALGATSGAEISLPALPRVKAKSRLISAVLLGITAWAIIRAFSAPALMVTETSVRGEHIFSAAQIRSIARVDEVPAFMIDPAQAEKRLTAHPEVEQAHVIVGWPNKVTIQVKERLPMVAWKDGGRMWWLSSDGVAFIQHGDFPGLVKIQSSQPSLNIQPNPLAPAVAPQLLWAAGALSAQLPDVDSLTYDKDHGLGFVDPRGWQAYFGVDGDMVMKVRAYRSIADALTEQRIPAVMISVEDPDAPYYTTAR
jgi:cell division septal protein FtsQ